MQHRLHLVPLSLEVRAHLGLDRDQLVAGSQVFGNRLWEDPNAVAGGPRAIIKEVLPGDRKPSERSPFLISSPNEANHRGRTDVPPIVRTAVHHLATFRRLDVYPEAVGESVLPVACTVDYGVPCVVRRAVSKASGRHGGDPLLVVDCEGGRVVARAGEGADAPPMVSSEW